MGDADTKRVLLADDDMDVRDLVRRAIAPLGLEIMEARDGEETLETILVERPDLVVLDVMMPTLNGWEILKYMRSKPELADIPVLMLTGVGKAVNAMTAPLYGADAYLDKPFDIEDVVAAVKNLLANGPVGRDDDDSQDA